MSRKRFTILNDHSKEKTANMKVFISWSGERSQVLAQNLREWLPLVLHYVEPWLSEADISAGDRWAEAVAKELEESNFGIICVTRENLNSPWVLFEAGALAKSMQGSRVIPLLLDHEFKDITGPLTQFQAKKVEKSGLSEVINSINQASNQIVPETRAKQLFEALWPEFENKVALIPKEPATAKHSRPQHEILEELVASVRGFDSRLREVSEEPLYKSPLRRHFFAPYIMHILPDFIAEGPGDPIWLLLLISILRDDVPWLYEIGLEAYRILKIGPSKEAERVLRQFHWGTELLMGLPTEEIGIDKKTIMIINKFIEQYLISELKVPMKPRLRRLAPKPTKSENESEKH